MHRTSRSYLRHAMKSVMICVYSYTSSGTAGILENCLVLGSRFRKCLKIKAKKGEQRILLGIITIFFSNFAKTQQTEAKQKILTMPDTFAVLPNRRL